MFEDENRHYGLRKLSIGLASVLIGISFASATGNSVKADTVNSGSNDAKTIVKSSDAATKIDAKDDTNAIESNTESALKASKKDPNAIAQDIKQKAIKASEAVTKLQDAAETIAKGNAPEAAAKNATDGGQAAAESTLKGANLIAKQQNTAVKGSADAEKNSSNVAEKDSLTAKNNALKATVEAAKQGLETPAVAHSDGNETTLNVKGSNAITENMLKEDKDNQAGADPAKSKLKLAALLTTTGKKLSPNLLAESKVMTPAKDTNGGFDEATWGKLNVNDWTIKTLTDTDVNGTLAKSGNLELTSYNGDEQHVIIPNLLDIYNAGKADSAMIGNLANEDSTRVVISKDLLSQFSKNKTSIAFSKTHTDHISNKDVDQMSNLTKTGIDHLTKVYSKDSDLSNAFSYFPKESDNITNILWDDAPKVNLDATNFDVSNVTNMTQTFAGSNYDGLSTIADWDTSHATNMSSIFLNAKLSDLSFLSRWNTSNVTDMGRMFANNPLTNLVPIANWNTSNVTDMSRMFLGSPVSYADLSKWDFSKIAQYVESDGGAPGLDSFLVNYNDPSAYNNTTVYLGNNKTIPSWVLDMSNGMPNYCIFRANENTGNYVIITSDSRLLANSNGAYNHLTFTDNTGKQTKVDIPMAISTENATGDFASVKQRVLDFVNTEAAKQAAPTGKKWVMTDTDLNDPVKIANANFKLIDTSLPVLNTNDAYALDSKNGLHEHANVNDNGGYDEDYWGKINVDNWNYTVNGDTITINGLKDGVSTGANDAVIVPNLDDFKLAGKDGGAKTVYISGYTLGKTAKHKYYGLSKTNDNKFATDSDISNAFKNDSNLTHADLNSLDTSNVTDMHSMFDGAISLTSLNVSNWRTDNVTDMSDMFYGASGLTDLDVSKWDTSNVTNMYAMFNHASSLTSLDVSKWDTSKVTNMNSMFSDASSLTSLDVSNWNTGNVTDMNWMFGSDSNLTTLDVSNWDTSKVTAMSYMFYGASGLTDLDVSKWDTSKVTAMSYMFYGASGLTSLDVSNWDTGNVTYMNNMFDGDSSLTSLDVANWDTSKVTDMSSMFSWASGLTSLDVSNWDTSKVTDMSYMFIYASSLTSLDVSNWDTSNVTDMSDMFYGTRDLALIVNGDKFADYLVNHDSFAKSYVDSNVKSVTTDNAKLLQLLTNDSQHDSATRTITFTFPANYSPDLTKYHLTKTGNTYQIKQSADYDKPYLQGTVLINATNNIDDHHIDTTKKNKLSDTWQPNYDKLVLAHKNADGTVSFDDVQLPQIPGYKTVASPVNPASALFAVSFMALPKPVAPVQSDTKPAETVSPATPVAIEVAKPIKTEPKVTTPVAIKTVDLSNDVVTTTPDVSAWHVADEPDQDTYRVSNGKYAVELPHISNVQLHVIANDSTKDSILFTYKGQNSKYVFKIKFVNGHYLLTTYKIKSGKLVKLIDYNFIKSSKMIDTILDWLKL